MIVRRTVQTISLLLLHSSWGPEFKWLCNPVLSCHSCALAWFACPVGVFVHYSGNHLFPFFAIGMILLFAVLLGRLLCGWVCPFGFLQDLLYKIPGPKIQLPKQLGWIKYAVLILMVFLIPYFWGPETRASFCRICPASFFQVSMPNLLSGGFAVLSGSTVIKGTVALGTLGMAVVSRRSFCRILCPIGAMMALFNHVSFWKVTIPQDACKSCQKCDQACPTEVFPSLRIKNGIPANRSADCIVCHDCQKICN